MSVEKVAFVLMRSALSHRAPAGAGGNPTLRLSQEAGGRDSALHCVQIATVGAESADNNKGGDTKTREALSPPLDNKRARKSFQNPIMATIRIFAQTKV